MWERPWDGVWKREDLPKDERVMKSTSGSESFQDKGLIMVLEWSSNKVGGIWNNRRKGWFQFEAPGKLQDLSSGFTNTQIQKMILVNIITSQQCIATMTTMHDGDDHDDDLIIIFTMRIQNCSSNSWGIFWEKSPTKNWLGGRPSQGKI